MTCVLAATTAELTKLQTISRGLFVLGRNVVAALTFATLQHNVIPRHKLISPICDRLLLRAFRLSFLCDLARNRFPQRRKDRTLLFDYL